MNYFYLNIIVFSDCIKFIEVEESEDCEFCVRFDKVQQDVCQAHIGEKSIHVGLIFHFYFVFKI